MGSAFEGLCQGPWVLGGVWRLGPLGRSSCGRLSCGPVGVCGWCPVLGGGAGPRAAQGGLAAASGASRVAARPPRLISATCLLRRHS